MRLHLNLEHVIFFDAILLEVWQTRVLNNDSCRHVVRDHVRVDLRHCVLLCEQPTGIVVHDLVLLNNSVGVNQHDSVEIVFDDVLIDQELVLSLNDEDAFALGVFNPIELNLSLAGAFSSESDVGLNISVNFVGDDGRVATLNNQDSLVVVVADNVAVRERFEPEGAVYVVLQVLHSHLVSKVLVVKLGRLLLNSLES